MLASKLLTLLGKGGSSWLATLSDASIAVNALNVAIAPGSGSVYSLEYLSTDAYIVKHNSSGGLLWQRKLTSANTEQLADLKLDSSENVYCVGFNNTSGNNDIIVVKYDSGGTIQWQRRLYTATQDMASGVYVDSSGNVFIAGSQSGTNYPLVVKYNSAGVIQWQRTTATASVFNDISGDSSGNLYVTGYVGASKCLTMKLNSSGVIQWERTLTSGGTDYGYGIAVDSSGNIFTAAQFTGPAGFVLAKYNSSGTLQWQRKVAPNASGASGGAEVALDSSGNAYALCRMQDFGSYNKTVIVKYNTSGTVQWQRNVDTGVTTNGIGIEVSGTDFYLIGQASLSPYTLAFIAKLPTDGSLTGTYGVFTYASSSYTTSTPTYTDAAGTQVDSAASLTDTAGALTDAAGALTSTLYQKT